MADRDASFLAMELAIVLALQNRILEHARGAHEVDPVVGEIVLPRLLVPLEHCRPFSALSRTPGAALARPVAHLAIRPRGVGAGADWLATSRPDSLA
jgi:hypothetical protein